MWSLENIQAAALVKGCCRQLTGDLTGDMPYPQVSSYTKLLGTWQQKWSHNVYFPHTHTDGITVFPLTYDRLQQREWTSVLRQLLMYSSGGSCHRLPRNIPCWLVPLHLPPSCCSAWEVGKSLLAIVFICYSFKHNFYGSPYPSHHSCSWNQHTMGMVFTQNAIQSTSGYSVLILPLEHNFSICNQTQVFICLHTSQQLGGWQRTCEMTYQRST